MCFLQIPMSNPSVKRDYGTGVDGSKLNVPT